MNQCILTKLRSNHNNLNLDQYTGLVKHGPTVGEQFFMETDEEGGLYTTPVQTVRYMGENEVEFDTRNSSYRLEYMRQREEGEELHITALESDILAVFSSHGIHDSRAILRQLAPLVRKLLGIRNG